MNLATQLGEQGTRLHSWGNNELGNTAVGNSELGYTAGGTVN